eukprot:CAMPEP_0118807926 /NCGR_PEP_ID=MMETSP1161-20130426/35723_1 /TAXON_ID=249345 /ORGANISM="Picochlorum oklahomensis, Strain CCMP2329" /LENGTH=972 /DNA_ID=CAMNT_0006737311 /DNA_START=146 /DNA_END=3062 /DNA_ORIENTATION=+
MAVERSILTVHVPASLQHQVCRGQRPSGSSSLRQRRSIAQKSLFVVAHGDDGARFSSSSSFPHVLKTKKKKKGCIIHGALANDAGEQQQQQGGRTTTTNNNNNVPHQSSSPGIHMYDDDKRKDGSKRIVAEVRVQAQLEDVWGVLTDYEALPGFVPNLEVCERLPSAKPGVTRLRQVGCSQSILWRLEAEAELEVEEVDSSSWRKEVRFRMISGDFEELYGRWIVESNMASSAQMSTFLRYDICIQPRFSLPSQITSYIIKAGLPSNIRAIASRAESVSDARLKASGLASWVGTEVNPDIPQPIENASRENDEQDDEDEARLPSKGPFWPRGSPYAASAPITAERQNRLAVMDAAKSAYLGTAWVPLPPSGAPGNVSVKEALNDELEQKKKTSSGRDALGRDDDHDSNGVTMSMPRGDCTRSAFLATGDNNKALIFSGVDSGDPKKTRQQNRLAVMDAAKSAYLGTAWVPLPPSGAPENVSVKEALNDELQEKKTSLGRGLGRDDDKCNGVTMSMPRGETRSAFLAAVDNNKALMFSGVDSGDPRKNSSSEDNNDDIEIHLRRLDGLDYLHRRSIAAIRINAPPSLVWDVLTDYNRLAEFVPNLASSERIRLPRAAPENVVRVRQVGYKNMFYMCLHAESVMDLVEKPFSEVQFRQVAGDVERFQGKWAIQEVVGDVQEDYAGPQTLLKYAVEIIIPTQASMCGFIEPLLEGMVFEDMPNNLMAIKHEVERRRIGKQDGGVIVPTRQRPKLGDMIKNFEVLRDELEATYGDTRMIPSRSELRASHRTDLEKALSAHGGASNVAKRMGWGSKSRSRKPRGYWNSIENVKHEIDEFILSSDLPSGVMPLKNDFVRANRFDIARAIEKWGGVYELAEQLGYQLAQTSPASGTSQWQEHVSSVAQSTGLGGKQGLFEVASATYKNQNSDTPEYILSSVDLEDIMTVENGSQDLEGMDTSDVKLSSLPSARDEIDAW